jgi:hypothetical protein
LHYFSEISGNQEKNKKPQRFRRGTTEKCTPEKDAERLSFLEGWRRPPMILEKPAQKNKPKRFTTKKTSHLIQARPIDQIHRPSTTLHLVGPLLTTRVL